MDTKRITGGFMEYSTVFYRPVMSGGLHKKTTAEISAYLTANQWQIEHYAQGGWQRCTYPVYVPSYDNPYGHCNGGSYAVSLYVPKLAPLMAIQDNRMTVGGYQVHKDFKVMHRYLHDISVFLAVQERADEMLWERMGCGSGLDKEGYPNDPVPRDRYRESWVEKAMWQMGMSRSRYVPNVFERLSKLGLTKSTGPFSYE